jgi:hypothetical protein
MLGGVVFPLRMSIARLADGGLWLHSAVAIDDAAAAAIEAMGPVQHLVVPSRMHDRYAVAAQTRWPSATVWAPRGFHPTGLRVDRELGPSFGEDIEVFRIDGAPSVDEHVFYHRPSRSLLVTDLLFHVQEPENVATRWLMWAVGCGDQLCASRSWRWVFAKDLPALRRSLEPVLALPIERVVPCHGAVGGDASALREGLARLL